MNYILIKSLSYFDNIFPNLYFQFLQLKQTVIKTTNIVEENIPIKTSYSDLIILIIGIILGFLVDHLHQLIRDSRSRKIIKLKGEQLLKSILYEIKSGIERCDLLINAQQEGKGSFSRIYISLWPS